MTGRQASARRGRPLHFVTFHVDLAPDDEQAHPHTELARQQYVDMIGMLFASARLAHPDSRCTVLTAPDTDLSSLPKWVYRTRAQVDPAHLMRDRMAAQIALMEQEDAFDLPLVLIDSDALVTRPLTEVFATEFDVGLTWRPDVETMPFNGGVMFFGNKRPETARAFLKKVLAIYDERHSHRSRWFGDQTAIAEFVGLGVDEIPGTPAVEREGVRVSFFPCESYNYSPPNSLGAIRRPLAEKAILHFKGDRKRLMPCYFDAYIGFSARPSFRTLFNRFKARRALTSAAPELESAKDGDA